jgi:1-phosphofructokinase family hexose kinase
MIATVTLNPSLDKTIYVDTLVVDDTNRALRHRYDPGGKGLNISRVLWELGQPSVLFGFLGGHTGKRVEKYLMDEGLACDFNWTSGETRENLIITTGATIQQTKISLPGPPIREDEFHRLKRKIAGRSREFEVIAFSGSIPPGLDKGVYRELADEANQRGDRVVLDADGEALKKGMEAKVWMIKPNLHELQRMIGRELPTERDIHVALDEVLDSGLVELVILSRGGGGVIAATRKQRLAATPPKIEVRSTVGAGDSLIGGFLYQWFQTGTLDQALRYGIASGTACAASLGTELAHLADITRFLPQVVIEELPTRAKT